MALGSFFPLSVSLFRIRFLSHLSVVNLYLHCRPGILCFLSQGGVQAGFMILSLTMWGLAVQSAV
jgi:hypothetical protein